VIPEAVKTILVAAGLTAITLNDDPEFQKRRPRVEITYRQIGETTPKRVAIMSDGKTKRTSAFRGELKLHAITDADAPGKLKHSTYRAQVRNALATLEQQLNGGILTEHSINFITTGNEQTGVRNQDGFEQTTWPFVLDVSIQKDAWDTL
jgi:Ca2+-dependent lipid-binding protein